MSTSFERQIAGLVCVACGGHHHSAECELAQRWIAQCRSGTRDEERRLYVDDLRRAALAWAVRRIHSVVKPLDEQLSRCGTEQGAILPDDAPDHQVYLAELERLTARQRA